MGSTDILIESERLAFRLMRDSDLNDLVKIDTDPQVRTHFIEDVPTTGDILERIRRNRASFQENGYCDFAVIYKESGELAGRAGFGDIKDNEIEVGYVFAMQFWGQGLAQEALRTLLAWAIDNIAAKRIVAYAPRNHSASLNVMAKCGMSFYKHDAVLDVECSFYQFPLKLS